MLTRTLALVRMSALCCGLLLFPMAALAADLLRILPVTDSIIMLHFREGHIDYNGVRPDGTYEPQTENRVYSDKLVDGAAIVDAGRYQITSRDDADYAAARNPVRLGFKAKGTEFNSPYKKPPFLREYWVYAQLPAPLRPGKSYTVRVGDLAGNLDEYAFQFDEKRLRSVAIHVNQVGFTPDAPKHAYFSQWMGTYTEPGQPEGALDLARYADGVFHICDAKSGEIRKTYRGLKLQKAAADKDPSHGNWTKADVYSLDFSDFREPGRYVVVAEKMGCSFPFEIGQNVYFTTYRAAMRGVFLQRRGIFKDVYEFGREYPRSHHPDMNEFVAGVVEGEGSKINNPKPVKGIWGWYADAGDWDGNPTHYVVPFSLLLAYDLRPQNFRDGEIGNRWKERPEGPWVDEGSNGLPDILDEGRWLVEFYRRARHELMKQGLGTGGVPRYVGRDAGAHTNPAWADKRVQWVDVGVAQTTYAYAGAAGYLAHCLNKHHARAGQAGPHPESAGWIADAKEAFAWGEVQENRSETDKRLRQLAAVCLYLATGEGMYQEVFKAEWQADKQRNEGAWVSPSANQLASAIYLVSCKGRPGLDQAFYDVVKASIVRRTNQMTDNVEKGIGFRFGGVEPGQWAPMNLITVPRVLLHAVAHEVTGDRKYLDVMHTAMAYVLGGNPEGRTRLSGVGFDREQDVFLCDAWYLLDFNHKAYRNPIFPGLSAYGMPMFDVGGPGSEHWARSSALPPIAQWPTAEQRMRSRYSISGSEFTIHQNSPWWVFAAGYLLPGQPEPIPAFSRPTVKLALEPSSIPADARIRLAVKASGSTERVEYYCDWRFIGESRDAATGFAVAWNVAQLGLKPGDRPLITAIAYDIRGESSLPTADGEKAVTIGAGE